MQGAASGNERCRDGVAGPYTGAALLYWSNEKGVEIGSMGSNELISRKLRTGRALVQLAAHVH